MVFFISFLIWGGRGITFPEQVLNMIKGVFQILTSFDKVPGFQSL